MIGWSVSFSISVLSQAVAPALIGSVTTTPSPVNAGATAWLRTEIEKLTDQPITHLIYSHSHHDHAAGGTEYGDIANVITHANAPEDLDLVEPTIRFSDQMSFTQGDKTFELTWLGPGHGVDLIATVVRPDNVAFVVDAVSSKRLFYRDFPGADVDDWIEQVRRVNSLDFEVMIGGHGAVGVKADVAEAVNYLEELRATVLAGLRAGQSVAELRASIRLERYRSWQNFDQWRELNILGMARHLRQAGLVE